MTRGGDELPVAALGEPLPVDPGSVEIMAEAPGFQTERRTVVLGEGETTDVVIALQRSPATVPVSAPLHEQSPFAQGRDDASTKLGLAPASRQASGPRPWTARKTAAVVVFGTGVLALGPAGASALEERGKMADASPYAPPRINAGSRESTSLARRVVILHAALVSLGVGAVLVGAGLYLLVTGQSSQPATVGAGLSSLLIGGQW